jgi:diguanylate cyclase (GGDEF)-like protein
MSRAGDTAATPGIRGWSSLRAPKQLLLYIGAVDLAALIWCVIAISRTGTSPKDWGVLALLIVLAVGFEESARRAARLQLRLSSDMKRDMTSVWCVAGAVALRPGFAVLLLLPVMTYIWFRQQRPAGEILHRKIFNASTALLGCLGAGLLLHTFADSWGALPWMLSGAASVVVVIVSHTLINRVLVTGGVMLNGVRGRVLLGSADDNLIEIATLCLGGLVALAVLHQPWLAALVLAPMITLQRGALVRELETAATMDAKTGLLNAVAWEHLAQHELGRARREGYDVAVLIIDIDRFKLVNDQYGHLVGDEVLRSVGKMLAAEVREYDTVGRFGGEEFVAVLPKAGDVDALVVAERLRSRINELRIAALVDGVEGDGAADHALAVSVGVACSGFDGMELAGLLLAADGALYRAKAAGRNRVVLADRGTGETVDRVPQG